MPRGKTAAWMAALYAILAGFLVIVALTLTAFDVNPRRVAGVLCFITIVLSGLFWGRWPALLVTIGSMVFIDYFLIRPQFTFATPSLRQTVMLLGLLGTGIVVAALAEQVQQLRQAVRVSAERGHLQRRLVVDGIGVASVLVTALTLHALGAPVERLLPLAPFFGIVALTAVFCGGRPANFAAVASVIVMDYFFGSSENRVGG